MQQADSTRLRADPRNRDAAPEIFERVIDGRVLRVARWSAGEGRASATPLLFFSGLGANIELLAPFLAQVRGRDVVTFDVPGVGGSPAMARPYRLRTMARLADRLLDALEYRQVDVMGLSWGGMLAQQFAHQFPARVSRLVIGATSAGMTMVPGKLSTLAKMLMPKRYQDPLYLKRHFGAMYGGTRAGAEDIDRRMQRPDQRGYVHQLLAVTGWSSVPFLPRIKAPTLILMGAEDRLVPLANGYLLKLLMRDAQLEVIAGGGHLFALTHREQTARLVTAFLAAPRASATPAVHRSAQELVPLT